MARKFSEITELSQISLRNITSSKENWLAYLDTAANLYKYSFIDSVLIHAQRPTATAVASVPVWNRFNRYVKRGTYGIALFDGDKSRLRYVFDIADTQGSKQPKIWQLKEEHHDSVAIALQSEFDVKQLVGLDICLGLVQANRILEQDFDYIPTQFKNLFMNTLIESTSYMVFKRLGLPFTQSESFLIGLEKLRELDLDKELGTEVHAISGDVLRVIERLVKEQERELLENDKRVELQGSRRESLPRVEIQSGRDFNREVRNVTQDAPEREATSNLQQNVIDGNAARNVTESGRGSVEHVRASAGRLGEAESSNPDYGRLDENTAFTDVAQPSGGDSSPQVDLQQLTVFDILDREYEEAEPEGSASFLDSKKIDEPAPLLDFAIPNADDKGKFSSRVRAEQNIEAIKLLKQIETDERLATSDEQEVLAQYVGWGGISDIFEHANTAIWEQLRNELATILTDEEYRQAQASVLSAFYTPSTVIDGIYSALHNFNFKKGKILEPSMGIGKFFGRLPNDIQADLCGVELDSISARIARQLYQSATIEIGGFEKTNFPDHYFDAMIGNIPFGNFKVNDPQYNHLNYNIHDYFAAKSLDKVRSGGIVAFVTSTGTMDKKNSEVRKYLSERADLIGAIRLPNNTFKGVAGTSVTSDILFLQKKELLSEPEQNWIELDVNADGIEVNQWFVDHPNMILGNLEMRSGQFGMESTVAPYPDKNLSELLLEAIGKLSATIGERKITEAITESAPLLPVNPDVKNFSFTMVGTDIYYQESSSMSKQDLKAKMYERVKGLIEVRQATREVIRLQVENHSDSDIEKAQASLNTIYDEFVLEHGRINGRANRLAFRSDADYPLLASLEILDNKGDFKRKADLFSKRTISPNVEITSVDSSIEAFTVSMNVRGYIDIPFMTDLTDFTATQIEEELLEIGVMYANPETLNYEPADEYLSGNVREKLRVAQITAAHDERYNRNVEALKIVQPEWVEAHDIHVRLGATWIPTSDIQEFMHEVFDVPIWAKDDIAVEYSSLTSMWQITNKSRHSNINTSQTYGTERVSGYKVLEDSLNLRDVRVYDKVMEGDKEKRVLNKRETILAGAKQTELKRKFEEFIFRDPERRKRLEEKYNLEFNSVRLREFSGNHLTFSSMNPLIKLREHQVNWVARTLYGGNTLLAGVVGSGKTYAMIASAMELKRIGLAKKPIFVVPNHLISQWGSEFMQLYPSANILLATKQDFEAKKRKQFCSRIATGSYDAIIIGHSSFEKIPLSEKRQIRILKEQIDDITEGIRAEKESRNERFTVKQMERMKKQLEVQLEKLQDAASKDNVVTFEELGVDYLFVDEGHYYKVRPDRAICEAV